MRISIIHPSRGRPIQARDTYFEWYKNCDDTDMLEYILSIDDSDDTRSYLNWSTDLHVQTVIRDNVSSIEAINRGVKRAEGDLLIVVSDDFSCFKGWDTALREALWGKSDYLVKTKDGCQPWIVTLPIMDRTYYNRFGYIYYPGYKHLFCDTEMTHVGALLGKTITLDLHFPHRHYTQVGGQPKDAINEKNDATFGDGEKLYLDRLKNNFYLQQSRAVKLPHHHISYLKSRGIDILYGPEQ